MDHRRTLRTAGALSFIAYSGLILVVPRRVRTHLFRVADDVTFRLVHASWTAFDDDLTTTEGASA